MELKNILKLVELFHGLNENQIQHLTTISYKETFRNGDTIFSQGGEGDAMFIIGQGQVEVRIRNTEGRTYSAIYLGEGQVFGEMALIDQGKRSATIIAIDDDTMIYRIPADEFHTLCKAHTDIGYIMMRNLAQDLSFKLRHTSTS
jgi:CRP-like cAMP-binding protein